MLFRNAEAVFEDGVKKVDILVENGCIKEIAPSIKGEGIDLKGLTVFPGLVDMHVPVSYTHLTLPTIGG